MERMLISGVALDTDAVRIAVIGLKDEPGVAFKLFDTLAKKNINVDVILQSIGRAGRKDISFTVDAVSYTHLDVYKRQKVGIVRSGILFFLSDRTVLIITYLPPISAMII